jgi:hypothetical protein
VLVCLPWMAACGARSGLFVSLPESQEDSGVIPDGVAPIDASFLFDAGAFDASLDAKGAIDAATFFDADVFDASVDATSPEAGVVDAQVDSGPIRCTAASVTRLASTGVDLDQVALDDSYVYYHENTGIWRTAKSGGAPTQVATMTVLGWPDLAGFAVNEAGVIWWQVATGAAKTTVYRAPGSGGAPSTVATLGNDYASGSLDSLGSVYLWYGGPTNPSLDVVMADGVAATVVSLLPTTYTLSVVSDGKNLFESGGGGVLRFDGTEFTAIADLPGTYAGGLAFDDTTLYFETNDGVGNVTVSSVPKTGGTPTTLFSTTNIYVDRVVVDGPYLYFVNRLGSSIIRMNKDGTSQITVVQEPAADQIMDVAIDDRCIYWSETAGYVETPNGIYATPK